MRELAVLMLLASAAPDLHAELRAGAAAVNITADHPAPAVHDPLFAKALILEQGGARAVIISLDLGQATEAIVRDVREGVRRELGFDPAGILVNASHNHHTYGQEAKDLATRIVAAVKEAHRKMAPARIGVGLGREERITMNRRLRLADGRHSTIRLSHPSPKDAEVTAVGPFDPQIGLLRVDALDGKPMALVYNFAGHPYGGVPGGGITADLPGFASRVIEAAWPGAVALFLQGAAGDITPVRYKDFDAPTPTEQLGTTLGLSTLESAQRISTVGGGAIRIVRDTLQLPRRSDLAQRIQTLQAEQERILESFNSTGSAEGGTSSLNFKTFLPLYLKYMADPEYPSSASYAYRQEDVTGQRTLQHLDAQNRKRVDTYLRRIGQMEKLIVVRTNLQVLRQQLKESKTGPIPGEVQAMKIGDFVLVTFPGELCAEIGLRIKKKSPFPHTFIAAYSNGHVGYAPAAGEYDKEAYEDSATRLAPQWQEIYERKALELIGQLGN